MHNETSSLILDGAYIPLTPTCLADNPEIDMHRMIAIAVSLLTIAYPGTWFPPMRRNKKQAPIATHEARIMQN